MSENSKNKYTPAILIVTFALSIIVVVVILVIAAKNNNQSILGTSSDSATPSSTPALNINSPVETLSPVQKIPLEDQTSQENNGKIILDPELSVQPSSSPSVLQDKNINFKLPKAPL